MRLLLKLLFIILLLHSSLSAGAGESGPVLDVSSLSGRLQLDQPSTLIIELHNQASSLAGALDLASRNGDAMGITAELFSSNEKIKVLSSPQAIGTLAPGQSGIVEFMALAKDCEAGVYPLQLRLSYFQLSDATASGHEGIPDLFFSYQNATTEIPLQASVVLGPQIQAEEAVGRAYPGKESELEIRITNRGDEPAVDLKIEAYSAVPFRVLSHSGDIFDLEPGGSVAERLRIFTENSTARGLYALPYGIHYGDRDRRSLESAALVYVERDWPIVWILIMLLGALLLAGTIWGTRRYLKRKKGRKGLRRLRG